MCMLRDDDDEEEEEVEDGLPGIVEGSDFVDEKGDGISYIVAMVVWVCCG